MPPKSKAQRDGIEAPAKRKCKPDIEADATDELTEAQIAANQRAREIANSAVAAGILVHENPEKLSKLAPSSALAECSGHDIYKKSTLRKGKYLFAFPGRLALISGTTGVLGQLEHLDSLNPCLSIDFPQGRLHLQGTILHTVGSKLLTLRCNPRAARKERADGVAASAPAVIVEDVFDKVISFSEATWLGPPDNNPLLEAQEMPAASSFKAPTGRRDASYNFNAGGGCSRPPRVLPVGALNERALPSAAEGSASARESGRLGLGRGGIHAAGAGAAPSCASGEAATGVAAVGVAHGRSRRASAAGKRVKYNEDGGSSGDGEDDETGSSDCGDAPSEGEGLGLGAVEEEVEFVRKPSPGSAAALPPASSSSPAVPKAKPDAFFARQGAPWLQLGAAKHQYQPLVKAKQPGVPAASAASQAAPSAPSASVLAPSARPVRPKQATGSVGFGGKSVWAAVSPADAAASADAIIGGDAAFDFDVDADGAAPAAFHSAPRDSAPAASMKALAAASSPGEEEVWLPGEEDDAGVPTKKQPAATSKPQPRRGGKLSESESEDPDFDAELVPASLPAVGRKRRQPFPAASAGAASPSAQRQQRPARVSAAAAAAVSKYVELSSTSSEEEEEAAAVPARRQRIVPGAKPKAAAVKRGKAKRASDLSEEEGEEGDDDGDDNSDASD